MKAIQENYQRNNPRVKKSRKKGQVLAVFAFAIFVVLAFAGLAIDSGMYYMSYLSLKNAVDASVVAAANDFKQGASLDTMNATAMETLTLNQFALQDVHEDIFICDADGDGVRDLSLLTAAPDFYNTCPDTSLPDVLPKKYVYGRATYYSPVYFLSLFGIVSKIPITLSSIAEAAAVDLVVVLDTSESMGVSSPGYVPDDFNPGACNADNTCAPLLQAKDAAKGLINTLYPRYDRVAVVTFNQTAVTVINLNGDLAQTAADIDTAVGLHDDAPVKKLWSTWYNNGTPGRYNPVNPEDRDGDGADSDDPTILGYTCQVTPNRWDPEPRDVNNASIIVDPFGWGGVPCDDDNILDAFDWNGDGVFDNSDQDLSDQFLIDNDPLGVGNSPHPPMSIVSTCTGCGLREATNILLNSGRQNSVWVIILLSDGIPNLSDTPDSFVFNSTTGLGIPSVFHNGFCGGRLKPGEQGFWTSLCIDNTTTPRYCIDNNHSTCPPNTTATDTTPPFSVYDYARDMADFAALTSSTNLLEPKGNDISVYTIALGGGGRAGAGLLRYVAAVGDDGNRETDPCSGVNDPTVNCGQYYFAPDGAALQTIFEDIASRIYTKITR
jgi:hypothetical protein